MGISIHTNMAALSAWRQLARVGDDAARTLGHLSTGKRINGAADDAAGLGVVTRMVAQHRGLRQSSLGLQDAVSMLQVADGGARSISQMLQRMRELSVQAGSGALTAGDRRALQAEVDLLSEGIQVTAEQTTFNQRKLLDSGAPTAARLTGSSLIARNMSQVHAATAPVLTGASVALDASGTTNFGSVTISGVTTNLGSYTNGAHTTAEAAAYVAAKINDNAFNVVSATVSGDQVVLTSGLTGAAASITVSASSSSAYSGLSAGASAVGTSYDAGTTDFGTVTINNVTTTLGVLDNNMYDDAGAADYLADQLNASNPALTAVASAGRLYLTSVATGHSAVLSVTDVTRDTDGDAADDAAGGLSVGQVARGTDPEGNYLSSGIGVQMGANASDRMTLTVPAATAVELGVAVGDLDLGSVSTAQSSLATLDAAIAELGIVTANLGALMNRLSMAITGLEARDELLEGARSRIEDADMAHEVVGLTRQGILRQSATAMLGQANQDARGILRLLTG